MVPAAKKGAKRKPAKAKPAKKAAATGKAMRYDWDKLFDGKDHVLTKDKDFTGTTRAAASMVRWRARQRGAKSTAEAISATQIRVHAGDPAAGAVARSTKAKAKPARKAKPAKAKAAAPPAPPAPAIEEPAPASDEGLPPAPPA